MKKATTTNSGDRRQYASFSPRGLRVSTFPQPWVDGLRVDARGVSYAASNEYGHSHLCFWLEFEFFSFFRFPWVLNQIGTKPSPAPYLRKGLNFGRKQSISAMTSFVAPKPKLRFGALTCDP